LELLLGFLKNPKYKLRPILKVIEEGITDLRENGLEWGYDIPYQITGIMNMHPRTAMKNVGKPEWAKFTDFYDEILDED